VCGFLLAAAPRAQPPLEHPFELRAAAEVVAIVPASCQCEWGVAGREAVVLRLSVDGRYSQHLLLTRGNAQAEYRVLLGPLPAGAHRLTIERDHARSAPSAGEAALDPIRVEVVEPGTPEHEWISRAPILHARPGTVERFSDVPLLMYVERARGAASGFEYTVIFSHEDGGTPTDRLMATWGRSTDIEFVYGITRASSNGAAKEEYQGLEHEILPFRGPRTGTHPLLWVTTENNMVSDNGSGDAVRFAPAPHLVMLDHLSREAVMDRHPWLYQVMAAELLREGRIDPEAPAGSGRIADPRRFAYVEACADVKDATLAVDLGVEDGRGATSWHPSDRGDPRFRVARGGCFRAAVPMPEGVTTPRITGARVRAYTRPPRKDEAPLEPGTGRVTLRRLNQVFMLDERFQPGPSMLRWNGAVELKGESGPAAIPARRH
jgi:hypothetical protein